MCHELEIFANLSKETDCAGNMPNLWQTKMSPQYSPNNFPFNTFRIKMAVKTTGCVSTGPSVGLF